MTTGTTTTGTTTTGPTTPVPAGTAAAPVPAGLMAAAGGDEDPVPPDDPCVLLREWLPPDQDPERPLVTLATVDADGAPDARTVLLSGFDGEGLHLHTDARSRKAAQMLSRPAVALVIRWPEMLRQLVVRGDAEPVPSDRAAAAYARRTPYLRRLARLNSDELARLPLPERRARWAASVEELPDHDLTPPDTWLGFLVRPHTLTFWTGDPTTASRRVEYARSGAGWVRTVLPG